MLDLDVREIEMLLEIGIVVSAVVAALIGYCAGYHAGVEDMGRSLGVNEEQKFGDITKLDLCRK